MKENMLIMFIQETKCLEDMMKESRRKVWQGSEAVAVDARGTPRCLVILWNPREVFLFNFLDTLRIILVEFQILGFLVSGVLTNVYEPQFHHQNLYFYVFREPKRMGGYESLDHKGIF